jgi:carbon-monoxide dehydrogenase large subunit
MPTRAIKSIDTSKAAEGAGRARRADRRDLAADKIGGLICGWMIHSKDGSPMKAGAHPAHRPRQGPPCRRPRRRW